MTKKLIGKKMGNALFMSIAFFGIMFANNVFAAGIVPCGTGNNPPCTLCHLAVGVKSIFDWGMNVMTFFAIAIIVAMAIVYIVSAGNNSMMTTAKNGIKTTLFGFAIMLGSWVIVNYIMITLANNGVGYATNWHTFTCDTTSSTNQTNQTIPPDGSVTAQTLPVGCGNYNFANTGVDACLLKAISSAESGCNPNIGASPKGACGLMQLLPSTAGKTCDYLNSHPQESIQIAASKLTQFRSQISAYSNKFSIGEDDLIASYNAGSGSGINSDGTKQPFAASVDCPGMPAWQCPINPGGFAETQNYVKKVQSYKASCN